MPLAELQQSRPTLRIGLLAAAAPRIVKPGLSAPEATLDASTGRV